MTLLTADHGLAAALISHRPPSQTTVELAQLALAGATIEELPVTDPWTLLAA
jgi:hypothetical protein